MVTVSSATRFFLVAGKPFLGASPSFFFCPNLLGFISGLGEIFLLEPTPP
jgi:hypothetical protein